MSQDALDEKNRPEQFDEAVMNQAVLETGNEVGDLAMVKIWERLEEISIPSQESH